MFIGALVACCKEYSVVGKDEVKDIQELVRIAGQHLERIHKQTVQFAGMDFREIGLQPLVYRCHIAIQYNNAYDPENFPRRCGAVEN